MSQPMARAETQVRELLAAEPPLPDFARAVKAKFSLRWPVALRRLAQMRRDYPRDAFLSAVTSAAHFGMYELDRLERMVLRNIASEHFVNPVDRDGGSRAIRHEWRIPDGKAQTVLTGTTCALAKKPPSS